MYMCVCVCGQYFRVRTYWIKQQKMSIYFCFDHFELL